MREKTTPEAPAAVAAVAAPVQERLAEVLAAERDRWATLDPALDEPMELLERLVLSGGKRLRPAFCYWGFVAAGGSGDDARVIDAGAAFELLHAFALIHDDVMDGSPQRRGLPSVHAASTELHEKQLLLGEARRFGEGAAILVGDLAHVFADRLMAGATGEALVLWHELEVEVNIGQYLDLLGAAKGSVGLDDARRISRYKSGRYTIERPLQVGAALAGADATLIEVLGSYGEPLGEAFQLRDDMLGAFGDPALTGKPVGEDLREGKPTPLLAIARQRAAGDPAATRLLQAVGRSELSPAEVSAVQEQLEVCGAREEVERLIAELRDRALSMLESDLAGSPAEAALRELADYVTARRW